MRVPLGDDNWAPTKKGKKGKKTANDEEDDLVAKADDAFDWVEWSFGGAVKKGYKGKKSGAQTPPAVAEESSVLNPPEEPELASPEPSGLVAVPSPEPDVEQSNVCPFQAQHILEGDGWWSCKKCRAAIRQLSIQFLNEGKNE